MSKAFCTNCNINWASLTQENSRHSVEVCPVCKSDSFLTDHKEGDSYLYSPISGVVYNSFTHTPLVRNVIASPVVKETKPFNREAFEKKEAERVELEMKAIDRYQEVFADKGQAAAQEEYFKVFRGG